MSHDGWTDPRIPKAFFKAPTAPTAFETESFVRRAMARIETARLPAVLRWLTARWTVPALGFGIAALLLSILYTTPAAALVLEDSLAANEPAAAWVVPMDEEL